MVCGYHADRSPNPAAGNCQPSDTSTVGLQPLSWDDHVCKHLRMEPDGDPEARIRDLERPLADQAHASELGTRPYEATPAVDVPVTYPQYGSPYYSPPQRVVHKRPQTALWLVPLVVIGVVGVGIVGLVAFFNLAGSSSDAPVRPGPPGIAGGGGSVDAPRAAPRVDPTDDVLTVAAGGSLSIAGVEQRKTVVCDRGSVSVSGVTNTIKIQGPCASVSVSGMDNTVTVDTAETITASGFDNQVIYRDGNPEISKSGRGNIVEQG
ncbi:DUF3060 domain-containing protein [Mycolicibacterium hippocampi]|uniref:DUF3060 domain-containing protein n=2 Tax=Mycolicibacterium hippocampi TaxID=659824 RepID=A0A7I9ZLF7_9MYCO|nr:hypothetical protein MHIP_20200 [Mycolicibacterium hippocampi]